jgi:glycosyltransferase involved in cell wall biosynthesis
LPDVCFVCPTYAEGELHPYTRRAVLSFLRHTPGGSVVVVDDASAGWYQGLGESLEALGAVRTLHNEEWGGLTRSWNQGLALARAGRHAYALAGNNDLAFCDGWYEGLLAAIDAGFSLAGPVSNAPGITSQGVAEASRYVRGFRLDDDPDYLDGVSATLRRERAGVFLPCPVNGFCMLARTADWWSGAYDDRHVFRPRNDFNSKGQRIPDPLNCGNEDELQGRWARLGRRSAVVPSSFVFHYRSVARGPKHAKGRWLRSPRPDRAW